MKIRLVCPLNDYLNDVQEVPRAFAPALEITQDAEHFLEWKRDYSDGKFTVEITSDIFGNAKKELVIDDGDSSKFKKLTKRFVKNFLYDFLSENLKITLPYGSLTGVRPTKLYYELMTGNDPIGLLKSDFRVSETKAKLIKECVDNQRGIINESDDDAAIFLNVPFCPTRCSYCSFISTEIGRVRKELPLYIDGMERELNAALEAIVSAGKTVTSIYVGGGTPVSIGAEFLDRLLRPLKDLNVEFTVEAGRPDVITSEVVEVMKNNNVTRVSVNPQTFKQSTLALIGRKHTVEDIYRAYGLVSDFSVNMDLIAGLPDESEEDFEDSLKKTLELAPDNITVHSLSLKRGSVMTSEGAVKRADGQIGGMTDYARTVLAENGYAPYYMYRQKNTADNLENVGYAKCGKQCKYNIDMMEESITVVGIGAGAISKKKDGTLLERLANPKGFREYVDRNLEIVGKKAVFFEK